MDISKLQNKIITALETMAFDVEDERIVQDWKALELLMKCTGLATGKFLDEIQEKPVLQASVKEPTIRLWNRGLVEAYREKLDENSTQEERDRVDFWDWRVSLDEKRKSMTI